VKKRFSEEFFPANRRGMLIDAACILLNLFLFPFFNSRVGDLFDRSFGDDDSAFRILSLLMIILLVFRFGGLYLKRFGLQARRSKSSDFDFPAYFIIFNIPIVLLTASFAVICIQILLTDLEIITKRDMDSPLVFGLGLFAIFVSIITELFLLFRLRKPLNKDERRLLGEKNRLFSPQTEMIADFGLFAYMMIWQVFYSQIVALFFLPDVSGQLTSSEKVQFFFVSLFVFLIPSFLMFYVSPRTVFLIEDRKHKATWLGILFVFISTLLPRLIFRVLN
jgi:hypothetical protein